jgi:glycosyltransferase involved in cell wall biosynthesis
LICYIVSDINYSGAFHDLANQFSNDKVEIFWILVQSEESTEFSQSLEKLGQKVYFIKQINKRSYLSSFVSIFTILRKTEPSVVHCHLFNACLLGLLTSSFLGIKKRIYTRHHSSYNLDYNPKGILFDYLFNSLATDIIAVSKSVATLMIHQEKVSSKKIHLVPHGFSLDRFQNTKPELLKKIQLRIGITGYPVVGVISRWIKWKGIEYIIQGFQKFINIYPNATLLLINNKGPYRSTIEKLLDKLPDRNYKVIPFEKEIEQVYQSMDIYVHTPIDSMIEAFGQTYVEALASGTPSIFTLSGIANEIVIPNYNALVVPHKNSEEIFEAMKTLMRSVELRERLRQNGLKTTQAFSINNMVNKLYEIYRC